MDSVIHAASRALVAGDPLGALKRVALRDDPPALALRGIAMAQLGDLPRARELLRRAAKAFGPEEHLARARCIVAEAEIALVSRELSSDDTRLEEALRVLERHADAPNAAHARHLRVRRLLLIGRLDAAERELASIDPRPLPPAWRAAYELAAAGIGLRRLRIADARSALARAREAARASGVAALGSEVVRAERELEVPAARLRSRGTERNASLGDVEALFSSSALVVDGCRRLVRDGRRVVSLASRPVLMSLARTLAESWPGDASRAALLEPAFGAKRVDASHRARLRVEIGRLRVCLEGMADVRATERGFALTPSSPSASSSSEVVMLAPPIEGHDAAVLALLADGEAWSSSALALALGASQRTVQRALEGLASQGRAQSFGRGRARQWTGAPIPGFTTTLLLPGSLLVG